MKITVLLCLFVFAHVASVSADETQVPVTVDRVDLKRYQGLWYEVTKIPNRFQEQCEKNTTAEYTLREDGRVAVVNRCVMGDGQVDEARGLAKIVDNNSNAKLKVSFVSLFGFHFFWGDYWVIGLDQDYGYAVVGTPSREYGWVLSRTPLLTPQAMQEVEEILIRNYYDPKMFEQSRHSLH